MKIKITFFILVVIIIIVGLFILLPREDGKLVAPGFISSNKKTEVVMPSPSPTVKTFEFDSTTDLNLELEKVDPEVLDSDFE